MGEAVEILPCKCGDYPRVRPRGSYLYLICETCGYESAPFLNNYLRDVVKAWNESDRDRDKQLAGVAAFNNMMAYCNAVKGTPAEDEPVPKSIFKGFFKKGLFKKK